MFLKALYFGFNIAGLLALDGDEEMVEYKAKGL